MKNYTTGAVYTAFKTDIKPITMPAQMAAAMDNVDMLDFIDDNGDISDDMLSTIAFEDLDISGVQPLPEQFSELCLNQAGQPGASSLSCSSASSRPVRINRQLPNRFAECSMDDLDEIALKKNAHGTHKNTKWGIDAFRGEHNY